MNRWAGNDVIVNRLRQWLHELNTDRHRMAHMAPRAIAVLQEHLRDRRITAAYGTSKKEDK